MAAWIRESKQFLRLVAREVVCLKFRKDGRSDNGTLHLPCGSQVPGPVVVHHLVI